MSKPASTSASPSATACSGVPLRAPSNIESTVTLTIPAASGCARSRVRSASRQVIVATVAAGTNGTELRLHRPRRHPARRGGLALPRRRGRLLAGPGARARGLPAGRGRGRDHVRPPRAPGPRGGAADGPDLLHLRGRLRLRDRRRDDADDRRDGAQRGRHDLRADRGPRHPPATLRALRRAAGVPRPLAQRPRPLPPLPRQGRRRRGQRPARRARRRRPAPARQRRHRPPDADRRGPHPRLPPGPPPGQQGGPRSPPTPAPAATTRPTASPSATRSRTSRSPPRSAASSSSPTGPSATPACARKLAQWGNATVTEGSMGDGFYEAIVSTLVERR